MIRDVSADIAENTEDGLADVMTLRTKLAVTAMFLGLSLWAANYGVTPKGKRANPTPPPDVSGR